MQKNIYQILLFFSVIILPACFDIPKDATIPNWDVDINIPITQKDYYLVDIIEDNKELIIDSLSGDYLFCYRTDTIINRFEIHDFLNDRINISLSDIPILLINGEGSSTVAFNDDIELDSCHFASGEVIIEIKNNSPTDVELLLEFPEFTYPDGSTLEIYKMFPANMVSSAVAELKDVGFSSAQGAATKELRLNARLKSGSVGDTALISLVVRNTRLDYISGKFPPMKLKKIQYTLNLPIDGRLLSFRNKVFIHDPRIFLFGRYKSDFLDVFDLRIDNLQVKGKYEFLADYSLKNISGGDYKGTIDIQNGGFTQEYSNEKVKLSDFISTLPDSLSLSGDLEINPAHAYGSAGNEDYFELGFFAEAHSYITVKDVLLSDTIDITISDEIKEEIRNGKKCEIVFEIENETAFTSEIELRFAELSSNVLFTKQLKVEPAVLDSRGFVSHGSMNRIVIDLSEQEIFKFTDTEFIILNWLLNTDKKSERAALRSSDKIGINIYGQIKYHLEP